MVTSSPTTDRLGAQMVVYWRIVTQAPLSGCLAFGSPNQPHPGRIIRSADEFDSGSFESTLKIEERLRPTSLIAQPLTHLRMLVGCVVVDDCVD
jgi:hypothetical protein